MTSTTASRGRSGGILLRSLGLLIASLVACRPALAGPARPPFDPAPFLHPQRLVTIAPGRRLNLFCTGHGKPVVILDSGLGGPTTAWASVQPAMSGFTEVCSYDRAGQGFSDPGPLPRDTDALVDDLHALLHAAALPPPYVLVGHSLAGLDAVLFADRYRPELAGMVLVDPSFAHQQEAFGTVPGVARMLAQDVPDLQPCLDAARTRHLPTTTPLVDLCLDHDPTYSPALTKVLDRMALSPDHWSALTSELASFRLSPTASGPDVDSAELDRQARPLGDLPLIVLTAGDGKSGFGLPAPQDAALNRLRMAGHDRIAALSSAGRNQVVPDTGHYIQLDRPQIVIAAIREVVDDVRGHPQAGQPGQQLSAAWVFPPATPRHAATATSPRARP